MIAVEAEQLSGCVADIVTLRRMLKIVTRTLSGDLAIEFAFGILLPSFVPLIKRHRNELFLEHFDNFGIFKSRLTVEDAVVSRAAQRMAIHRPDKHWLLLLKRHLLGFQQIGLPVNRADVFSWDD